MKEITTKYDSTCRHCNGSVYAGERVMWAKGKGVMHLTCWQAKQNTKSEEKAEKAQNVDLTDDGDTIRDKDQTFRENLRYGILVLKLKHVIFSDDLEAAKGLIYEFFRGDSEEGEIQIPADSGDIPADSGNIPADSGDTRVGFTPFEEPGRFGMLEFD